MGRDTPLLRGIYRAFVRAKVETGAEEAAMRNRRERKVQNDRWNEKKKKKEKKSKRTVSDGISIFRIANVF